ncbi:hypothetical protein [Bacteroides sp.]|uniref:hypothetical protein n=1 Tax=Bacteroides sp. TaxID=29523 RepID=UPI002A80BF97|nr:hypothetical protein [Bacteroides sp.]
MIIYSNTGSKILETTVDDNSYRHLAIMGDDNITLHFSLAEHVEIPVGSYLIHQGERYTLERPESLKMKHSRYFEYTIIMESYQAKAKIWKFRNPVDGRLKFSLTAKPKEHLQMFVDNMNRRDSGWEIGDCIDGAEILISYNHAFCFEALGQMASECKTEYEFVGKRVSLRKVEYNKSNPLALSYGRGNGFKPGVGRSNYGNTPPIEILYVQGGTDNIDASKYGSTELLLPKNQTIAYDGEHFEDEDAFNPANARTYVVDDLGLSIRRNDKGLSSLSEDSLDCSEIYPKRIGSISSIVIVDAANNFYDIIDDSIPTALNYEDCLIEGETMTVIFQSGMLAGREFEVKYYHDAIKDKAAHRFEIVPAEIDGQTMPNVTFAPKPGDTYAVFKCMLPESYICDNATKTGASWDMFRSAVKYLFDNEEQKFSFTGELDGLWAKKDWVNILGKIKLGGYVLFSDERFQKDGVLVRITGIKEYINNSHSPEIELSNSTVSGSFSTTLKTLESDEVLVDDYHRDAIQFTKRRFRDAKETMLMLEEALLDNFTNSINPIAIQTMQLLIGDERLQFRFVNSKTNPSGVAHSITYDNATKQLTAAAGIIQHLTIGINTLSSSHAANEYKYWDMTEYTSARLEDGTKKYYLYAKVSTTAQTGVFLLSEIAMEMETVKGYYNLLVGVLNSEYDGERSFAQLYGFTEILPGRITTDRVVSGDGNSYFDMLANAMKLGSVLDFNSAGDGKLRLKGTIVQSQSGEESYIGCYRGLYNSSYTYYNGDEVIYTINGNTSTYRYIYATSSKGIAPTSTTYWQIVSQGAKGNYTELRYAKNGSTTAPPSLTKTTPNPSGWTTTTPSVGTLEYLWMTTAVKNGNDGTLVSQWTTPVRITPYNGKDGENGKSPVLVYRGIYNGSKSYYGNTNRLDCVKNGSTYYIARIDAGTFSTPAPPDTSKWNSFGASFESIATNLLLAEGANIGDWFMSGGKIVSTLSDGNKITLDASMSQILIESIRSGGDYSEASNQGATIKLDAYNGLIEARSKSNSRVAYMSPTGIFCNNAETQAVSAVLGVTHKAAIVGLGFGNVNKSQWDNENFIAGVYGRASNDGTAPAYGGFFQNLMAAGLLLHTRFVEEVSSSTYLYETDSLVIGISRNAQTVYLPSDGVIGRIIFIKQWWAGYMRVYPRSGQHIYDDTSENSYYDFGEGQMGIFTFVITYIGGVRTEAWLVNKFKY